MNKYVLYDKSINRVVAVSGSRLSIHKEYWKQIDEFEADRTNLKVIKRASSQGGKLK